MAYKILIVEDDRFLRELISRKLLAENYQVCEAIDGEEGVRTTKKEKPDLVLMDLILPGIDGFEALTRIKQDEETTAIPVIILSNQFLRIKFGFYQPILNAQFSGST